MIVQVFWNNSNVLFSVFQVHWTLVVVESSLVVVAVFIVLAIVILRAIFVGNGILIVVAISRPVAFYVTMSLASAVFGLDAAACGYFLTRIQKNETERRQITKKLLFRYILLVVFLQFVGYVVCIVYVLISIYQPYQTIPYLDTPKEMNLQNLVLAMTATMLEPFAMLLAFFNLLLKPFQGGNYVYIDDIVLGKQLGEGF